MPITFNDWQHWDCKLGIVNNTVCFCTWLSILCYFKTVSFHFFTQLLKTFYDFFSFQLQDTWIVHIGFDTIIAFHIFLYYLISIHYKFKFWETFLSKKKKRGGGKLGDRLLIIGWNSHAKRWTFIHAPCTLLLSHSLLHCTEITSLSIWSICSSVNNDRIWLMCWCTCQNIDQKFSQIFEMKENIPTLKDLMFIDQ